MDKQKTSPWALASLDFAVIAAIILLLSGYGYQWGWWGLRTVFLWIIPGSAILALIGFSLAVVFGFSRRSQPQKKGAWTALGGVVLSIAVIGTVGYWFVEAQSYPPIHDISTDIESPPKFRAIVPLRSEASNDTTYESADIQRKHYPDIQTLYLNVGYGEAFDRALQAAEQMPWEQIVTQDKTAGLIEAVDKLPWFGFKDDIVIRVDTADSMGNAQIDVRSVSRIGRGDIGVNAHRIREYLEKVKE